MADAEKAQQELAIRFLLAEDVVEHQGRSKQAAGKYDHINFKPPESVANAAAKGLEYRQKASPSNKGGLTPSEASKEGIGSGVSRATSLKNRSNVSPKVIGQMVGFFSRHEKNKGVKPEHKNEPWNDKGHVAWLLWGGDAGKTWATKVKSQMDAADKKSKTAGHPEDFEVRNIAATKTSARVKNPFVYDSFGRGQYFNIGFQVPRKQEPLWWTGSGFKDLSRSRGVPEDFPSAAAAERKIKDELLDFILEWRDSDADHIRGWSIRSRGKTAGHPEDFDEWWEYLDPGSQRSVLRELNIRKPTGWNAREWEKLIDYYVRTHVGDPRGWYRVRNIAALHMTKKQMEMLHKDGEVTVDGEVITYKEAAADVIAALEDACWEGYEAIGMKEQDGRTVPNCVPKQAKTAKSNAKMVEVPNTFHPVKLEPPKKKRTEFPFEGYIDFQGIQIDVENVKGSTRKGVGPEGEWSTFMHAHYGEIRGTEGVDGDMLDVYVGDNHDSSIVVVIHQHNPWDGKYDEDKVVIGCESVEEAIGLYKKQYDRPGFYREGEHTVMPIGAFWRWVHEERNKGKKVKAAVEMADTPVLAVENRRGYAVLQSGGTVKTLTTALNMHMVRRVPPPGQVPKVRGAVKAFSFHWSNAQGKWDVISIRDFPWGIDGAEFILFVTKTAVSPLGKVWTLPEMQYVAKGLNPHPGAAFAVRAANQNSPWKDQVPGGRADKKKPSDFDPKQLQMGIEIETEHTKDRALAEEIAMDHLTEIPDYYTRLKKMEDEVEGKRAMWKKGYTEGKPGAIHAAKTVFGNLLAMLRAISWNHLAAHWQVGGDASYGDHLLFERMYEATTAEIDTFAEKLVGTFGISAVDPMQQAKLMAFTLMQWDIGCPFERSLVAEKTLQVNIKKCVEAMDDLGQLSFGMDDFLRTLANDHETNIYLLQQRQGGVKMANLLSPVNKESRAVGEFLARGLLRLAARQGTNPAALSKFAREFTEKEWATHKKKHPKADPRDHTIKKPSKGDDGKSEKPKGLSRVKSTAADVSAGVDKATERFKDDGGWKGTPKNVMEAGVALMNAVEKAVEELNQAIQSAQGGDAPAILRQVGDKFKAFDKLIWEDQDSDEPRSSRAAVGLYDDMKGPVKKLEKLEKHWGKATLGEKVKGLFGKKGFEETISKLAEEVITAREFTEKE